MIGDALATVAILFRVLWLWIIAIAVVAALLIASLTAAVAWAWNAVRSRPARPSWARGHLRARRFAHTRTRGSTSRTTPHSMTAPAARIPTHKNEVSP
ncbi:hypothetical protein [Streptomyces longispororuber]|uniref:hypothetical protein n=1 Tax=Streptomyces longispororuber TaxID=68230 RepID=UPI0036F6DF83